MAIQVTGSAVGDDLKEELAHLATEAGFMAFGVARAEPLGSPHDARLGRWLQDGFHGSMSWMERTAPVRLNPGHGGMLPGARSVIVLASPYGKESVTTPDGARIARYARSRDYHRVLHRAVRPLLACLAREGATSRASVDSLPVWERAWAEAAGLGFVGKNSCLIIPGLGSYFFLTAVVTTAPLRADSPMPSRCGDCTACLDLCPTGAFAGPGRLDSRRCISYLTIESRDPSCVLPPGLEQSKLGSWLFGCDVCQEVCPFNRAAACPSAEQTRFCVPHPATKEPATRWATMDEDDFERITRGSPMRRAGLSNLKHHARRYLKILQ